MVLDINDPFFGVSYYSLLQEGYREIIGIRSDGGSISATVQDGDTGKVYDLSLDRLNDDEERMILSAVEVEEENEGLVLVCPHCGEDIVSVDLKYAREWPNSKAIFFDQQEREHEQWCPALNPEPAYKSTTNLRKGGGKRR